MDHNKVAKNIIRDLLSKALVEVTKAETGDIKMIFGKRYKWDGSNWESDEHSTGPGRDKAEDKPKEDKPKEEHLSPQQKERAHDELMKRYWDERKKDWRS